jgi:hypothetical protein
MFQRYKLFIIITFILGLVFFGMLFFDKIPILIACPFKAITGFPCPGCGGIRAVQHIFHGEHLKALYTNPLSCILFCFCGILPIWSFYDCYTNKRTLLNFLRKPWPKKIIIIVLLIILANWIWNIIKGL